MIIEWNVSDIIFIPESKMDHFDIGRWNKTVPHTYDIRKGEIHSLKMTHRNLMLLIGLKKETE